MQQTVSNTPGSGDTLRAGADKINANFLEIYSGKFLSDSLVLPKTAGVGLKVDPTTPTFGWRDLIGQIFVAAEWATNSLRTDVPVIDAIRGTYAKGYAFKAGDKADVICYHLPHDYVKGTDLFLHVHWVHNGTAISGQLVIDYYATYAKGHNQALFNAEIDITNTIPTPSIAAFPRWQHNQNEIQLSSSGGGLNTDLLEPDGIIMIGLVATQVPTITGGAGLNLPFILNADIHYQSTGMGTKARVPDFYT
jgi:hypothetical protein